MPVPLSSRLRVPEDVLVSELDGEAVLLKLQSESYFGLDAIGTRMWHLLRSTDNLQTVVDTLVAEFETDADTLRQHVGELVEQLIEHGLVEIVSP